MKSVFASMCASSHIKITLIELRQIKKKMFYIFSSNRAREGKSNILMFATSLNWFSDIDLDNWQNDSGHACRFIFIKS